MPRLSNADTELLVQLSERLSQTTPHPGNPASKLVLIRDLREAFRTAGVELPPLRECRVIAEALMSWHNIYIKPDAGA